MPTRRSRSRASVAVALAALTLFALATPTADAATLERLAGNDRYATAAEISKKSFPTEGVAAAFVATGESFPDALSAGAAGAKVGGPVLLTRKDVLPQATRDGLLRLKPLQIVVLGGTAAVSDAVFADIDGLTAVPVERLSGFDRYETSAKVTAKAFPTVAVDVAYIATGVNFADALAGAPAAGARGGPLLLVRPDGVPGFVAEQLARLTPQFIVILGGTAAVSSAIETELDTFTPNPVIRLAGADRYLTAVEVSKQYDPNVTAVYLATGSAFPDALAGGPPAGIGRNPLLLVHTDCIPPAVDAEITRLNPAKVIVLGGPGAVSNGAAAREICESGS